MNGPTLDGPAPEGLAEALRARWPQTEVEALRDALYRSAYARDLAGQGPMRPGMPVAELRRLLSASNRGRDRWEAGWRIERVEANGAITAARGAIRRSFPPGDYAPTFTEGLPPRAGMAVHVFFPRESLTVQREVYYAFGDAPAAAGDENQTLRVYLHAPEDALPELYSQLTGGLNRLRIPFTLKTMLAASERDRGDATVLYLAPDQWPEVEVLLKQLPTALLARLSPRTPMLTLRIAPGIGLAESPASGESFGMHRCRLLAESILDARRAGREDEEARMQAVKRKFQAEGIDLARPHLRSPHGRGPVATRDRIELSVANVVEWLRRRGLISPDGAEASWRVRTQTSRNFTFAVARQDGRGFFVKQLRVRGPESLRMMEREAAVYGFFADRAGPIREISPAFHRFDRNAQALVLELEPDAAAGSPTRPPPFSAAFATAAARALALLHRQRYEDLLNPSRARLFERRPPGVYDVHRGGPLVQWLGAGQSRLVDRLRELPDLASALDRMFADWRCDRLIHGDVKWENCLWRGSSAGPIELKWIDWELTDVGDPAWDAGCFLQAYLSHGVRSLPPQTGLTLAERMRGGASLFSAMQPALWAFMRDYTAALETPGPEVLELRERILRCAAARMFQMGLEVTHGRSEPPSEALCLLETSAEIMRQPGEALSMFGC
jgi:hypothetical protein